MNSHSFPEPKTDATTPIRILHFVTGGFSGATQVAVDLSLAALHTPGYEVLLVLRRKPSTDERKIDALRQRWGADLPAAIMTGDTEDAELRQTRTDTLRVLYKPLRPAELRQVLVQLWRAEGSEHPTKEPAP